MICVYSSLHKYSIEQKTHPKKIPQQINEGGEKLYLVFIAIYLNDSVNSSSKRLAKVSAAKANGLALPSSEVNTNWYLVSSLGCGKNFIISTDTSFRSE